ncbi:MAG: aminotransferase class V-fold PLP-dependent enzyme [Planctomycetota bacterium]|jgi:kynureninase
MPDSDPLLKWRHEFPITETTNYLISNSLGAMPRAARKSAQEYLDGWDTRGVRAWADSWWQLKDEVAAIIEGILGVDTSTVSTHQNVAMASQAILSCFSFDGPRNKIVYTDLNFPSVMYLYEAQQERGAEVVRVPADAAGVTIDQQQLLDAIDEKTLLVPISHAIFRSSFLQDAKAICDKARSVGAFVILDVFQSVGCVPLQLKEWGVHAAVGGALKYLCGGPGNCFLYVDPDERLKIKPTFTGWAAHRSPFEFLTDGQDYREDGGRFLNGTPNVPALFTGKEGIRIVSEIGAHAIRKKSQRLTSLIVDRSTHHGFTVRTPLDPELRAGHVSIDVPDGYEVCQALLAEDIICDYRPNAGIRLSPHFYTKAEECTAAVDRIAEILVEGSHEQFKSLTHKPG